MLTIHNIGNFILKKDCDFLIEYHKKFKDKQIHKMVNGETIYIPHALVPFYHLRTQFIFKKYIRKVKKYVPGLIHNHTQIVYWEDKTLMLTHRDTHSDWTSICNLNDDYEGGETIVEGNKFAPRKGRTLIFEGSKLNHRVDKVKGNRYTLISWWDKK